MDICAAPDCPDLAVCRGYCNRHYRRILRNGDTTTIKKTGPKPRPLAERFWEHVVKGETPDDCWDWLGEGSKYGYGLLGVGGHDGGHMLAHRFSYELHIGLLTTEEKVRHVVCANPPCTNPRHLAKGSQADNVADTVRMGRTAKGEQSSRLKHPTSYPFGSAHARSRLTEHQVVEMLSAIEKGTFKTVAYARKFGVSHATISRAVRGKTWKHVSA